MIRNFTTSFILFTALVSTVVGVEPESIFPQPQLPPSPRLLQVSRTSQLVRPIPAPAVTELMITPVPESTHGRMLSSGNCGSGQMVYDPNMAQPVPFATWWSNTAPGRLVHQVAEDSLKAKNWPDPYVQRDRDATRLAFTTMVEKGWKRQNILGDVHFDGGTDNLNMAGRSKIRRILFQGLRSRRDLFICRADTKETTDSRLNSVETYVTQLIGNVPNAPRVAVTNLPPAGWPAHLIDTIFRKYDATMPDPRIPEDRDAQFTED